MSQSGTSLARSSAAASMAALEEITAGGTTAGLGLDFLGGTCARTETLAGAPSAAADEEGASAPSAAPKPSPSRSS